MGIQCPFTHWHIEQTTTILLASREAKLNFTKRKLKPIRSYAGNAIRDITAAPDDEQNANATECSFVITVQERIAIQNSR